MYTRSTQPDFVTFRLVDSLPKKVLLHFEHEHAEALRRLPAKTSAEQTDEVHRELRRWIEHYLDQGAGECHLRRPTRRRLFLPTGASS